MAPPSKTSGPNLDPDDLTSDYHRLYLAAQKDRKNRSPDGPMANYLTAIGLREPDDTWDVGETQIS